MAAASQSSWDEKSESTNTLVGGDKEDEDNRPKCSVCNKSFPSEGHVMQHLVTHLGEGDLVSDDKPVVSMEKPFKCTECNQTEVLMEHLEEHLKQNHPNRHSRPYKCADCGQNVHARFASGTTRSRPYGENKSSNAWFAQNHSKTKYSLKQHLQTCKGKNSFQCDKCGKKFSAKGKLDMHSISHMEKVHKCNMCFKSFGREVDLKQHQKYH